MTAATIRLVKGGGHRCDTDSEGCLFEAYNWLTRQHIGDTRPPGVSTVLHQFGMNLNDILPDDKRQQLARFLPNGDDRLAGTEGDGKDETRGYIALDWLIRTCTPAFLDAAGLTPEATELRALRRVADQAAAQPAGLVVRAARGKAAAAWDAAAAAAWDAAWDAARDAAAAAARDAAWAAAWDAARDAAGDAAWDAAWDAAAAAAWDAAKAAAWAAAGDAAGDAAWAAAWDAAGDAARERLAPIVALLQDSAITLYDQLITGEWPDAS